MGEARAVHGTLGRGRALDQRVRVVVWTGERASRGHEGTGSPDERRLEVEATVGAGQAGLALVEPCPKPPRVRESSQGGGLGPSGRRERVLEVAVTPGLPLPLDESQSEGEVKAPFSEARPHVAVADHRQADPRTERRAWEGTPDVARAKEVEERSPESAVTGLAEVLTVSSPRHRAVPPNWRTAAVARTTPA